MSQPGAFEITARVVIAVGGGYVTTATGVLLLAWVFAALGIARSEAVVLASVLGFLLYLAVLLWAFSERRLARVAWYLLGGTTLYAAVLWCWA